MDIFGSILLLAILCAGAAYAFRFVLRNSSRKSAHTPAQVNHWAILFGIILFIGLSTATVLEKMGLF